MLSKEFFRYIPLGYLLRVWPGGRLLSHLHLKPPPVFPNVEKLEDTAGLMLNDEHICILHTKRHIRVHGSFTAHVGTKPAQEPS